MVFLLAMLMAAPVLAQPADCPAVPMGPPMDMVLYGAQRQPQTAGGTPRTGAILHLGSVPSLGTLCSAPPPAAADVLHGPPSPHGLLSGDGDPTAILHGQPEAPRLTGQP
jgi:hypothetical protein